MANSRYSRRGFLASAAGLSLAGGVGASARVNPPRPDGRDPLAVLGTVWRPLSCLYHVAGRFVHGWPMEGRLHVPAQAIAKAWVDQVPENDLSKELARSFGFGRTRTVHEALVAGGRLGVTGVLLAAEHGNYPRNDSGQVLYPRFDIFAQIVAAFHEVKQAAPVYVARQLSHEFAKARQMVDWSRELGFPLFAGSPLPFVAKTDGLQVAAGTPISECLAVGFGPVEVGGFDALEALQSLMERRGQETGIKAVTCLTGRDVWRAGDEGRWSWELLDTALAHSLTANLGDVRANAGSMAVAGMPATPPIAFLVEYVDGTRGTVLLLNGHVQDVTAAVRCKDRVVSSGRFELLPAPGLRHYDLLAHAIERFFETHEAPAPVERSLLTTGALEAAMQSHARRGARISTPHLEFTYRA